MHRPMLAVFAAALALSLGACGGPTTAAAVADPPPQGVEVDRTVTGPEEVVKFQVPPGIENKLKEAVHKIGTPVNYTVYLYNADFAAKAALDLWAKGAVGTDFPDVLLSQPGPDALGAGALHLQSVSGEPTIHHFVGRSGPFVVVATSDDEQAAKNAAKELFARLPKK